MNPVDVEYFLHLAAEEKDSGYERIQRGYPLWRQRRPGDRAPERPLRSEDGSCQEAAGNSAPSAVNKRS